MGVLKKLAGQTAIYGISSILGRLLNIVLTPFYTSSQIFPPEEYGIFTDFYAWVAMINVILIFGMETTFFRFIQDHKEEGSTKKVYSQAFLWVLILGSVFLLCGLLFRQSIASAMGYPDKPEFIMLISGIIFLDVMAAMPMARLRYEEKAIRFSVINLINIVLTVLLNFILILGIEKLILYVFVANLIASGVRLSMALWGNLPAQLKPDRKLLRELIHYGFFIMVAGLAGMIAQTVDRTLLPRLWEDGTLFNGIARTAKEMNGLYGANYKVAVLIGLATQAFRYAVEPFFFKRSNEKDSPETFARVFHYYLIAALIGFLVIASFAREIVSFEFNLFGLAKFTFIGEKYWSALGIVPILLMAYVLNGAYVNLSIWFKITKQVRFAILFTGTGALIVLLINVFTIPTHGYMGSAWATLTAFAVMCVMVYLVGQKYYPIPYRIRRITLYAAICIAAYFLNRHIGPTNGYYPAFFIKALICLAVIGTMFGAEKYLPVFGGKHSPTQDV